MNLQTAVMEEQVTPAAKENLSDRITQLETEVAALKVLLHHRTTTPYRPRCPASYAWLELPEHLQGVTDYSQVDPDDLIYVHELTPEDVRRRLDELERWYGMTSAAFYRQWQRGEVDDIYEKIEWSMWYESWIATQRERTTPFAAPIEKFVA
ncbi:MAG: hypothetical protein R3C14_46190 [Caldilineaceae bacterium]